jgi:hypothetical protein
VPNAAIVALSPAPGTIVGDQFDALVHSPEVPEFQEIDAMTTVPLLLKWNKLEANPLRELKGSYTPRLLANRFVTGGVIGASLADAGEDDWGTTVSHDASAPVIVGSGV